MPALLLVIRKSRGPCGKVRRALLKPNIRAPIGVLIKADYGLISLKVIKEVDKIEVEGR